MSKLLRKLTDEEIEKADTSAGSSCSWYKAMLPGYVAACTVALSRGGSCGCAEMKRARSYIAKHC
ncbi:hypothetical protein [Dellaglioa algida]|uniref:hypothetical protein n=1 Tax=Dellaglioa algida TaxID=105612 RepID=UPI0024C4C3E6|nr:hypothetical protein [Dellaglioa algida]MDK1726400.1 hypothetical protein [Dellaglioa algida]